MYICNLELAIIMDHSNSYELTDMLHISYVVDSTVQANASRLAYYQFIFPTFTLASSTICTVYIYNYINSYIGANNFREYCDN